MDKIQVTFNKDEIETLIYGCMAAISSYCINDEEAKPYADMIRRLEDALAIDLPVSQLKQRKEI